MYWCVELMDRETGHRTMVATTADSGDAARQQHLNTGMIVGQAWPLHISQSLAGGPGQENKRNAQLLEQFIRRDRFTHRPAWAIAQGLWIASAGLTLAWIVIGVFTFALGLLSIAGLARSASGPPIAPPPARSR
jgi:hypothetical protein